MAPPEGLDLGASAVASREEGYAMYHRTQSRRLLMRSLSRWFLGSFESWLSLLRDGNHLHCNWLRPVGIGLVSSCEPWTLSL
jgi:hypothetical protein